MIFEKGCVNIYRAGRKLPRGVYLPGGGGCAYAYIYSSHSILYSSIPKSYKTINHRGGSCVSSLLAFRHRDVYRAPRFYFLDLHRLAGA